MIHKRTRVQLTRVSKLAVALCLILCNSSFANALGEASEQQIDDQQISDQQIIADQVERAPKGIMVSHAIDQHATFFGGSSGQIAQLNLVSGQHQWKTVRLPDAGLITGLEKTDGRLFAISSKGSIYVAPLEKSGELSRQWQLVYQSSPNQDPLFNIKQIDEQTLFAAGAFGQFLISEDSGSTWQAIGDSIDNPDGAHLYKIVHTSNSQRDLYGVYALMVGEFGQVFLLKNNAADSDVTKSSPLAPDSLESDISESETSKLETSKLEISETLTAVADEKQWQWQRLDTEIDTTLFDGHYLSDRWVLMFGVGGVLLAYDLQTEQMFNSQVCSAVSVYASAIDDTGRNLFLAGGQNTLMRISLLDEGENAPPTLTCQKVQHNGSSMTDLAIQTNRLLIGTESGIEEDNLSDISQQLDSPQDIMW